MELYHVKKDLFGIKAGTVERFSHQKAGMFLQDGSIEPYEEKRHGRIPGSPPYIAEAEKRRDAADAAARAKAPQAAPSHKQIQSPLTTK